MDFMLLHQFVTVVDAGSFSAAAEELFISQPTLSGRIKHLEQELGIALLERTTRKMQLTDAGKKFYRHAVLILEEEQEMLRDLGVSREKTEGCLSIWYSPMVSFEITGLLAHLSRVLPNVKIKTSQNDKEYLGDPANADYDLLFVPSPALKEYPGLRSLRIMETTYCAVLPVTHPLAKQKSIRTCELRGMTLLHIGSPGMRHIEALMNDALTSLNGTPGKTEHTGSNTVLEIEVASGQGYAILPGNMASRAPEDLCYIPISDFPINADRMCIWSESSKNPVLPAVIREVSRWKHERYDVSPAHPC